VHNGGKIEIDQLCWKDEVGKGKGGRLKGGRESRQDDGCSRRGPEISVREEPDRNRIIPAETLAFPHSALAVFNIRPNISSNTQAIDTPSHAM